METILERLLADFNRELPGSETAIRAVEGRLGVTFPEAYVAFLKLTDGGHGFFGAEKHYAIFFSVAEVAERRTETEPDLPGALFFGSNGGGEGFAFDTRVADLPVVQAPWIGMEWDVAIPVGDSFIEFLEEITSAGEDWPFDKA